MTTITTPPDATPTVPLRRDVRTFQRRVAAAVLLVPGTAVAVGRLFTTDDANTRAFLDSVAADSTRHFTFTLLGFLAVLTVVPAFLAAARLARPRRPVLTTVALGVNLVAYLGGSVMFAIDSMYLAGGSLPPGQRDGAAALIDAVWSTSIAGIGTACFVIGHVLGAILMGLALRGSIPTVGWVAMIVSQPGHVVAFVVLQNAVVDALAWGGIALCFAFCAAAVLRTPDDEWDVPPRPIRP